MEDKSVVSLFCGAGGLDIGFHKAGYSTIWANDFNNDACDTFRLWSPSTMVACGDISEVDFDEIPDAEIIIGGFPCQGFSMAGPRKLNDSRNSLYKNFVRLVALKKPEAFVAENVKGLLSIGGSDAVARTIVSDFANLGYKVSLTLVDANDYGVPENRIRTIIVGIRDDLDKRFYMPRADIVKKTIGDVLSPDDIVSMDDVCQQSYSSRYMSRNRIRNWDQPSFTIPAMAKQVPLWPGSPAMRKIDSDHWTFSGGGTRRLSYKEAAKIQTFPEDMVFCGDLVSKYKQIGNAVPPQLGYVVAKRLEEIMTDAWDNNDIVEPLISSWD